MISIFDIELLSPERLGKIVPYSGTNINEHRLLVAEYFLERNKLKDSPLHTQWTNVAISYLSMTNEELRNEAQQMFKEINNVYKFKDNTYERLIIVYFLFVSNRTRIDGRRTQSYTYEYDPDYIDHISKLPYEDLHEYIYAPIEPEYKPEIIKAYAANIYDRVKSRQMHLHDLHFEREQGQIVLGLLIKLAFDREDNDFYIRLVTNKDVVRVGGQIYAMIYAPSQILYDKTKYKEGKAVYGTDVYFVVQHMCESIVGKDVFYELTQNEFNEGIELILRNYPNITCEQLMGISRSKWISAERQMLNALVVNYRLCQGYLEKLGYSVEVLNRTIIKRRIE